MPPLTTAQWCIAFLSAGLIGLSKTGLPGTGILAIPLMAMVLPARESTGAILPLLMVGDVVAVAWYRRHAAWPHLLRIIPWTATGIVLGCGVLKVLDDRAIRVLIGATVLVMLGLHEWNRRRKGGGQPPTSVWVAGGTGLTAGVATMVANAAGPIMTMYLLAMRLPKTLFIGTAAWYFMLMNAFKVPFSAGLGLITRESLRFDLALTPGVLVGAALGLVAVRHIPERAFGVVMQALAAVAAVRLLLV